MNTSHPLSTNYSDMRAMEHSTAMREDYLNSKELEQHIHGIDSGAVLSNHTDYHYRGSENFEHDDTGDLMNYSGVYDIVVSAFAENNGWEEGYDY